jgi:hypothetical protein
VKRFPTRNQIFHLHIHRETRKKMNMIGHHHHQMNEPFMVSLVESHSVEEHRQNSGMAKLILAALLAANRDEENCFARVDGQWRVMR